MSEVRKLSSDQIPAQTSIFDIVGEDDFCILSKVPIPLTQDSILADLSGGSLNSYGAIISHIFLRKYRQTDTPISFAKDDLRSAAEHLDIDLPQNLSDVVYALRHRSPIPESIQQTADKGQEWVIETVGRGKYWLIQRPCQKIEVDPEALVFLVEDQTPSVARDFGMKGSPLLDYILRKNLILEQFLGSPVEHLQSHVRASVTGVGQVEIGSLFFSQTGDAIIPVCLVAKPGAFNLNKASQTMKYSSEHYGRLDCRAVVAQLLSDTKVALFELHGSPETPRVLQEAHFTLTHNSKQTRTSSMCDAENNRT